MKVRLIKLKEVMDRTGMAKSTIYVMCGFSLISTEIPLSSVSK